MAVRITRTCDYPTRKACPHNAPHKIEMIVHDIVYRADMCDEHDAEVVDALKGLGFTPTARMVDGKRRDVRLTASGEIFTTADARAWLIEKGLRAGSATGRISAEQMDLYAAEH